MIDVPDQRFMSWLRDQDEEARIDLEVFWRNEAIRHPYIKANPASAPALCHKMILDYAEKRHGYEVLPKPAT